MISPELQRSLREWLSQLPWHSYLTLNLNTSSTRSAARTRFKRFCQSLDQSILGRRYIAHPERRAFIIMFPEYAGTTNPHLHGVVHFRDGKRWTRAEREIKVLEAWQGAVKSGTIDMQELVEPSGLARYIDKACGPEKSYDSVMISSEFFGQEPQMRSSVHTRTRVHQGSAVIRAPTTETMRASRDRSPDDRGERYRQDRAPREASGSSRHRRATASGRRRDDYERG